MFDEDAGLRELAAECLRVRAEVGQDRSLGRARVVLTGRLDEVDPAAPDQVHGSVIPHLPVPQRLDRVDVQAGERSGYRTLLPLGSKPPGKGHLRQIAVAGMR